MTSTMVPQSARRSARRFFGLLIATCFLTACEAREGAVEPPTEPAGEAPKIDVVGANEPRGLRTNLPGAQPGYTLFGPLLSDTTYLIDNAGQVVHTWKAELAPSGGIYLLENGNLLRTAREPDVERFSGGGQGGRIQEYTWDGELVWDFLFASDQHLLHHDIERLPNGNILAIAWEHKTADEARYAGRDPAKVPEAGVWPDMIIEIEPERPTGGKVVWKWHAWDHLVQGLNQRLENYADPADHPGRIDINGDLDEVTTAEELEKLKALGYVSDDTTEEDLRSDLFHSNGIAYNADLEQIVLSVRRYSEIWIIDHSTTTEEAAGSTGGRWGKGGDLLYRWGNPAAYNRGDKSAQQLFYQHDARWIPDGFPGAGNLTVFSNEMEDESGPYSAVYEIVPPTAADGSYLVPETDPFGPTEPVWSYRGTSEAFFFAPFISGAERLPNGNTLICSGPQGRFFEVTPSGEIVWEYWDPRQGTVTLPDGSPPHPVDEFTHAVFRASRIPPDHPAIAGRDLQPLEPQPPIAAGEPSGG
ncbi:MAG: aryl-sulfate sulfotransferase [Acidobacteriota bacterium]